MNWVNKHKLPAIEAIKYDNQPYLSLDSLWNALHSSFNTALHHQVNTNILDEIENKQASILSRSLMVDFILFSPFTLFYFTFLFSFLIFYF